MRNRYFKRILSLAMSLAIVLSLCLTAQAKNSITVILDGHPIELSAPAYIDKNDRTQVPVTIGPQLGITYHEGNGEVTFIKGEKSLTFRNGEKSAGSTAMDTAANLSGKVGYVPLAYLAQFFGYRVAWSASNNTVTLTKAPELTVDDIKNIQAYSELTYYAVAVTRVDITYKDGVDGMREKVKKMRFVRRMRRETISLVGNGVPQRLSTSQMSQREALLKIIKPISIQRAGL